VNEPPSQEGVSSEKPEKTDLFSGGKNHYINSLKKNNTHRHHKRRNRHQTLRKK
jgi:hypothetical protein